MIRYATIRDMDISNGEGIGVSLFTQGCSHHCKGCFNPETWKFSGGKEFTEEIQDEFFELCKRPFVDFISILGGEPLDQDNYEMFLFLTRLKQLHKPIYLWSGYTLEEIMACREKTKVLFCVDYLIDGRFEEDKKDLSLKLRGSSNQRVIDVKKSLKDNKVVLHCE